MLRLTLAREAHWLDLPMGVRLLVEPLSTALMVAARTDPELRALPSGSPDDAVAVAFAKAIATRAITAWEGVGDESGSVLPVSPEGIAALLDLWPMFERFQTDYVARGLEIDAEKNVSAPLPSGPSAGASATARPAKAAARTARRS